jgi:putative transcriptional regulator
MTKLEKILKDKGIKQVWLAREIRKSPAELNRWLKGKRTPSYENMRKIAKVLRVSVEEIFFDEKVLVSANENYKLNENNNKKLRGKEKGGVKTKKPSKRYLRIN